MADDYGQDIVGLAEIIAGAEGLDIGEVEQIESNIINPGGGSSKFNTDEKNIDLFIEKIENDLDALDLDSDEDDGEKEDVMSGVPQKFSTNAMPTFDAGGMHAPSMGDGDSSGDDSDDSDDSSEDEGGYMKMSKQDLIEEKTFLLEENNDLRTILKDLKISTVDISSCDDSSSIDDIMVTNNQLKHRYYSQKNFSYVQDGVMMTAWAAETIFDGEREILGFRPDLTDISPKAAVKLKRIKFESMRAFRTSTGGGTREWPLWKTMLAEFGPMTVLHMRQRHLDKKDMQNENYAESIQRNINNISSMDV